MSDTEDDVFMSYVKQISFLGAIALMVLWVFIILSAFFSSFGEPTANVMDQKAIAERLRPVEVVALKDDAPKPVVAAEETSAVAEQTSAADATAIDANAIVTATCAACHAIGLLESPKIGDKAAWDKRLEAGGGLEGLVKSSIAGKGAMPPKGGNPNLSDNEIKAAIEFMMK